MAKGRHRFLIHTHIYIYIYIYDIYDEPVYFIFICIYTYRIIYIYICFLLRVCTDYKLPSALRVHMRATYPPLGSLAGGCCGRCCLALLVIVVLAIVIVVLVATVTVSIVGLVFAAAAPFAEKETKWRAYNAELPYTQRVI